MPESERLATIETKLDMMLSNQLKLQGDVELLKKQMNQMDGARKLAFGALSIATVIGGFVSWFAAHIVDKINGVS